MAISAGTALKVVLDYIYPGAGTALNVFHYVLFGGDADEQDVIDAIVDWATNEWGNTWQGLAAQVAELNEVSIQAEDVNGLITADYGSTQLNIMGGVPGHVAPAANSAYLLANTSTPQVRGSKYVPGIGEGTVDDGVFNVAALGNMALLLLDYLSTINVATGVNLFPVVRSTKLVGFPRLINAGSINVLPAYQRRRKQGVGS